MALDFVVDAFVGLDGSKYYGTLKNGVPSGLGTCIWPNQCHYDGEWRDGLMHGFGTYVWKTGQRYDGEWKDGRRDGIGIKTYADGSMYDGFWRAGKKHGLGVFRPAPEETSSRRHSNHTGWQPQQQRGSGAGSPEVPAPADLAAQSAFAEHELAVASVSSETHELQPGVAAAAAAAAGVAAAPADGVHLQDLRHIASAVPTTTPTVEQQQQQQQQQQGQASIQQQQPQQALYRQRSGGKPHLVSPFLAAAAVLNSETSILGEPPRLANGSWQQPQAAAAAAATAAAGGVDTFLCAAGGDKALHAADAAGTSNAVGAAAAPGGSNPGDNTDSSALAPAVALNAGAAAPRKLFVREYNMGQLVREYPLTAEEIKMIFGFLWPKANKVRRHMQRVLRRGPRMQKKMGEVVYKGNPSYAIMANLQLGIRYSVGRGPWPPSQAGSWLGLGGLGAAVAPWGSSGGGHKQEQQQPQQDTGGHRRQLSDALSGNTGGALTEADFEEKRTLYFPTDGSTITPAHPNTDFKWNDYAPRVFRRLRRSAGIDEADYMISLGGSQALRQLSSPGKSGSMFLLSEDERFLVKTMRKSEMKVLLDMLPAYAAHMEKHPHSLITRFFGLHKLRPLHGRSVRFVVMANIFVTDLQIHRRYDIKGSTEGRTVGAEARSKAAEGDPSVIFKDLDVDLRIVLEQSAHDKLMAQLAADCELLRTVGVMDYSLLLGVHYPARHYTRASLEAAPSFSLDGTLPHTSPLLGGTLPGSTLGSFSDVQLAAGQDAAAGSAPAFNPRTYTVSDDDIQQPPQQLQRLVAQQQQLSLQLQQAQQLQQGAAAISAAAAAAVVRQQQQPVVEVFGPWSAPAAARLTGQSSVSSVGSERLAIDSYCGAGAGPGSSLGPSPQPPTLQPHQQLHLQQQQQLAFPAGGAMEGPATTVASPRQSSAQQQQHSVRSTPLTSGAGAAAAHTMLSSSGGASQAAAAAAAAAIAAAGAESAVSGPGWSSGGASAVPGGSIVTSAAGAGSGTTSGHGGAAGSSAACGPVAAHPQLLAMVNHPWAGSGAGARNWELFSGAAELEEQLGKVSERMQEMGFSEQRIKDVAELTRLKILGSKLKKSATRKEPPSVVLQAMQQQRQVAEGTTGGGAASLAAPLDIPAGSMPAAGVVLSPSTGGLVRHQTPPLSHLASLKGAFAGLGVPFEEDEEAVDTPMAMGLPDPRAPVPTPPQVPHAASFGYTTAAGLPLGQQLGINMLALAVPQPPLGGAAVGGGGTSTASSRRTSSNEGQRGRGAGAGESTRGPEEVILCFGIIDILQDYSTRKLLERTVKGLTHDKAAISVAPPKAYAKRFLEFVTHKVFMAESQYNEQRQLQQPAAQQQQFTQAVSLAGRRVSEASSVDEAVMVSSAAGQAYQQQQQQQQQQAAAMAKQPEQAVQLAPIATGAAPGGAAAATTAVVSTQAAGAGGPGSPTTPLLSFADAHLLAAGAADMNLGLLGSPEALSGPESSGAFPLSTHGTVDSAADGSVGEGAAHRVHGQEQQQLQQLVSAEEVSVSVSVPQVAEGSDSSASNLAQQQQQQQQSAMPPDVLPAVVVQLQQQQGIEKQKTAGAVAAGANTILEQQQRHQHKEGVHNGVLGGKFSDEGHQGGSNSPAEAEVIVVNGTTTQPQQGRGSHLGFQHANVLAKLGL